MKSPVPSSFSAQYKSNPLEVSAALNLSAILFLKTKIQLDDIQDLS